MNDLEVKINALIYAYNQQADYFEHLENCHKAEADEAHKQNQYTHERSCFVLQMEDAERKSMCKMFIESLKGLLEEKNDA